MNEHKTQEQAAEQAKKWDAAELFCGLAAALLLPMSVVLSKYLSPRLAIGEEMLRETFTFMPLIWVGVMAYCSARGKALRRVARGEKL